MNYLGSKRRLSGFIYNVISHSIKQKLIDCSFCDLFAGTGIVGNYFHDKVKSIIYNDREYYSFVINSAFFSKVSEEKYRAMLTELNQLDGREGFIFNQYSECGTAGRLYFSSENGQKIDAIRMDIERRFESFEIDQDFYILLLATLLKAVDKVANTASVYCAYLKILKITANRNLQLLPLKRTSLSHPDYQIFNEDSNELITQVKGDILYLDPPYNGREYGSYYHLLNTIALYDIDFEPRGKAGLRSYNTSKFCLRSEVENVMFDLLQKCDFQHIFLSYNNEGFLSHPIITKMMNGLGTYRCSTIEYKRFQSKQAMGTVRTVEYLHHLIKH
ncbi:modification methylase [Chryseobacterium carnipullorum]|uniref:site-specific DNA-methyltransferase (adenine-specific) n=1 Tax=Chryseobacterium carnipullorum TaxID=1124835 RepID=A0A376E4L8_CHRCU|nr:DNA adenine methylase [Chryseobacterium carnipullorum]AZA50677.1 modification methylase [Chryseobacterium carnipullorum]AZA65544.1 modification methylase [Chryseobacterium carnipullorum]STD01310.1 Modification methylase FokI [Chryseobacterium carnipullorum]